ncbi:MAG: MerR family transcriptional regulator [Pseudonocardia sp.]
MDTGPDDVAGPDAPTYSTGWVARRLGITPATLRTWHYRYRICPTDRTAGGHRRYRPEDLQRLERMRSLVLAGLPTAEAARVCAHAGPGPEPTAAPGGPARRRGGGRALVLGGEDPELRRLGGAAMALDQPTVARVVTGALRRHGVVATWEQLLVPVLSSIGERYARCGDCIDVEHLFTDCVRAALSVILTRRRRWDSYPPVLLACLDQEQHTLALHALAAALAEIGCPSRILGASVPPDALASAARRINPRAVFVWAQTEPTARPVDLQALPRQRPPTPIVVGGPGWQGHDLPPSIDRVDTLTAAVHAVCRDLSASPPQ